MRRGLLLGAILATACSASFDVPAEVRVTCADDGDCYSGMCAVAVGYCVDAIDREPLRLLSVSAAGPASVLIRFDDTLDPSTTTALGGYVITPNLAVNFANLDDDQRGVLLATDEQEPGVTYMLTTGGLSDEQGNGLEVDPSSAVFNSFFGGADDAPPRVLSPATGSVLRQSAVLLQWTAVAAAGSYTVQVGTDPTFASGVVNHDVLAPATELAFDASADVTYYWRVRADVTTTGVWSSASFNRLGAVIFVGCGATECPGGVGNRSRPLGNIFDALDLARSTGINELHLRGGQTYVGPLVIDGYGLAVRGGYDSEFVLRDVVGSPSLIAAVGAAAIITNSADTVTLDGLILEAYSISRTAVVQVRNALTVVLDDVLVRTDDSGESPVLSAVGIIAECPNDLPQNKLVIRNSVVEMASANEVTGVITDNVGLDIDGLTVQPRASDGSRAQRIRAIELFGGDHPMTIDRLVVRAGTTLLGDQPSTSIGRISGAVTIARSLFHLPPIAASPVTPSWSGLDMACSTGTFERSSVISEIADTPGVAFRAAANFDLVVRNNIIAARNGMGYRPDAVIIDEPCTSNYGGTTSFVDNTVYVETGVAISTAVFSPVDVTTNILVAPLCIFEDVPRDPFPPAVLHNNYYGNALVCALFMDDSGPSSALADIDAVNALNGRPGNPAADYQQHVAGNIAPSVSGLFVGTSGPLEDRDFRLAGTAPASVRQSGIDATGSSCGPLDAPAPCRGGSTDLAGANRTAPRSLGAFEY